MKKIAILIYLLSISISVMAHPEDRDRLENVGAGATITFDIPLNIKPNAKGGLFMSYYNLPHEKNDLGGPNFSVKDQISCWAVAKQREKFDRVIPAGTVFTLVVSPSSTEGHTVLVPDSEALDSIVCQSITLTHASHFWGSGDRYVTIGEFRKVFNGIMSLKIAGPKVVR